MNGPTCACGAVAKLVSSDAGGGPSGGGVWHVEWSGGRIGFDKLAVEDARIGATACPACQHRACVFMLARHARAAAAATGRR